MAKTEQEQMAEIAKQLQKINKSLNSIQSDVILVFLILATIGVASLIAAI